MLEDVMESPGFWILGGGGTVAVVLGYIFSKRMDIMPMPLWQIALTIIVVWVAAMFFSMNN
jgi:hypothetical protein